LQAAAVIGKTVPLPLLHAITALPDETLSRHLAHLQAAEFLYAASALPTATYAFRHILIQETAYQALLSTTRRQYHQQIARALAEHFPALAATQPELLAHHYTEAGCTAPAIVARQRAGELAAERSAHVEAIAHFTKGLALLQDLPATPERLQQELALQLPLATAQGFPLFVGLGTCWRGWALAMQGQSEAGLAQPHQGLAAVLATGQVLARPLYLFLLAEATRYAGQVEEGLRLLAEVLTVVEASRLGDLHAEVYRLQGELLLCQAVPNAVQAEVCFQQALVIARHQQAKSWELRAAVCLSRLWQRQGRRVAARQLMAEVYDWFTEGFDTVELQEAKALMEELGG
jgi:predicted ATPase